MITKCEFCFRVWVHPEDSDPAEVEVWYQGLEETSVPRHQSQSITEWARMSFVDQDFHDLFRLDKTKHWQVIGKATLSGGYCGGEYGGEYDEDIMINEYVKAEVPPEWFDSGFTNELSFDDGQIVDLSRVYLLTSGEDSYGDTWTLHSIHLKRESAERAKGDYEVERTRHDGTKFHYRANVEEWPVDP